ncbi:unnamed protein product [Chironomus riparius]|uniref:Uncharacterized protein n=1 Tax=Chironomus riparius TaxID=315576 RepID=A0A9N9RV58_9DIPT|nr:unnamed protein product [Chironomus riparius]
MRVVIVLALLVCLFAIAYVNAAPAPADEQIISDNVDAFHPSDDSEFSKKLIKKKLIILKVKALKKILGK